ncbi:SR-related and CTD-associated factor 4-like [Protopterus annectens]|uniref:SR-related and CTD-associated factor 4-like n=1 Tax=Protopterus annectens TaxID=7888 RepID=UPI001CFB2304|nr:SR-related and CTD-associated factor 4-like [Protopterus annectens]
MDAVNAFNQELFSLMDMKPPISRAKMIQITKAAIKAIKLYKHVVQIVEKFIKKCKPEFKVPGLYVIDSIVRQSRHQFGVDKDVFGPRFCKNITITFQQLYMCPMEDRSKIVRVLNLWQKNGVFKIEVIQPLLDMAVGIAVSAPPPAPPPAPVSAPAPSPAPLPPPASEPIVMNNTGSGGLSPWSSMMQEQQETQESSLSQATSPPPSPVRIPAEPPIPVLNSVQMPQLPSSDAFAAVAQLFQTTQGQQLQQILQTFQQPPKPQSPAPDSMLSQVPVLSSPPRPPTPPPPPPEQKAAFDTKLLDRFDYDDEPEIGEENRKESTPSPVLPSFSFSGDSMQQTSILQSSMQQPSVQQASVPQSDLPQPGLTQPTLPQPTVPRPTMQQFGIPQSSIQQVVYASHLPPVSSQLPPQIPQQISLQIPQQLPLQLPLQLPPHIPPQLPLQMTPQLPQQYPLQIPQQHPLGIPQQHHLQIPPQHPLQHPLQFPPQIPLQHPQIPLQHPQIVPQHPSQLLPQIQLQHLPQTPPQQPPQTPPQHPPQTPPQPPSQTPPQHPNVENFQQRSAEPQTESSHQQVSALRNVLLLLIFAFSKKKKKKKNVNLYRKCVLKSIEFCLDGCIAVSFFGNTSNGAFLLKDTSSDTEQSAAQEGKRQSSDPRRSRSRSASRSPKRRRSRSGSRSWRSRHRRSRSRSRERRRHSPRSRSQERRDKDKEKERKQKGLPSIKSNVVSVCSTTLWVGQLDKRTTQQDVAALIEEFGEIESINMIPPRGCAYIVMVHRQDAFRALQKLSRGNYKVNQKSIKIAWALNKGIKQGFKQYWDVELGVTYIPWDKVKPEDLESLCEGGMLDSETLSPGKTTLELLIIYIF